MREVIRRRFEEYRAADKPEGFGRLPDLILLDGGKGHVGAIRPLLREMGIDVPVYGMVKDDKHRTRAITEDGGEIAIQSTRACSRWCRAFRTRCTALPSATTASSAKRRPSPPRSRPFRHRRNARQSADEALYNHTRVSEATEEMLEETPGMNAPAARAVYRYFHSEENDGE